MFSTIVIASKVCQSLVSIINFKALDKNIGCFTYVRYIIGKHILLGLDFLVAKDILETVFFRRFGCTRHGTSIINYHCRYLNGANQPYIKGSRDMREQMELNKIHTKHLEGSIHHLEEKDLEK
ncbi:MAG: DUF1622 domain-containing protein [Candidatus Pacebacteria bacterium]|nr:DUF1622 domain-containing protein [Candidatus Paceibacterota bacterium]